MGCVLATVDGSEIPNNHRLDVSQTPVNNGINYLSTGAGLSPSTVACLFVV